MTQEGLFPVTEPYRKPMRKSTRVSYVAINPRQRTLCDDCIAAIHHLGVAVAPPPRQVRYRRTDIDGAQSLLCAIHQRERIEQEEGQ